MSASMIVSKILFRRFGVQKTPVHFDIVELKICKKIIKFSFVDLVTKEVFRGWYKKSLLNIA